MAEEKDGRGEQLKKKKVVEMKDLTPEQQNLLAALRRKGRPSGLTEDVKEGIVLLISAGNYGEVAAASMGIAKSTYHRWIATGKEHEILGQESEYRDFWDAVARARAQGQLQAVAAVRTAMGNDWRAAMEYLARTDPARWAPKAEIKGSFKHEGDVSMSAQTVEQVVAAARKALQDSEETFPDIPLEKRKEMVAAAHRLPDPAVLDVDVDVAGNGHKAN